MEEEYKLPIRKCVEIQDLTEADLEERYRM